jgi:hypothetical protein
VLNWLSKGTTLPFTSAQLQKLLYEETDGNAMLVELLNMAIRGHEYENG